MPIFNKYIFVILTSFVLETILLNLFCHEESGTNGQPQHHVEDDGMQTERKGKVSVSHVSPRGTVVNGRPDMRLEIPIFFFVRE